MVIAANLGFPRIGPRRQLKQALEAHWSGELTPDGLADTAATIRRGNWELQRRLGLAHVPSNDFSLYDHVLDTAVMVGAVPGEYRHGTGPVELATYFALARGGEVRGRHVPPLRMTKWFDTNYHYLVPSLAPRQRFHLASTKPLDEFREATDLGVRTRPVLLGPVSFLLLSQATAGSPLRLLPGLVPVYEDLLSRLDAAGAEWVQLDEPVLATDLDADARGAFGPTYARLRRAAPGLRLLVATYFSGLRANLGLALGLPVDALHLDLVAEPDQLEPALGAAPPSLGLSLGVIDGRNVWRADLDIALTTLEHAARRLGPDRVMVAPSCSLLHMPLDLDAEEGLDGRVRSWLAFAVQKVEEVVVLATALREGRHAVTDALQSARVAQVSRQRSPLVHSEAVARRLAAVTPAMYERASPYPQRRDRQAAVLPLPVLPTTTIGSLPQTTEVRRTRARHRRGELDASGYERFLRAQIEAAVRLQEELGLDVVVHGEFERTDMVEYFAERLSGFALTDHGWVQSYGSRCVKPPILYGDVARPGPITLEWACFAQQLTTKPVKAMLTGPVTMLRWSFARDDQAPEVTCRQLALALRDEVAALEAAGLRIIQVDEPALAEGLPLHDDDGKSYLEWAVGAFRLATSGVGDETQVHTHMCYADFGPMLEAIAALDADVLTVEASRAAMEPLGDFQRVGYPNAVGPGLYDVHSPRVPEVCEIATRLRRALERVPAERLWVNPDCGLKTRRWEEVLPALERMVEAAGVVRAEVTDR